MYMIAEVCNTHCKICAVYDNLSNGLTNSKVEGGSITKFMKSFFCVYENSLLPLFIMSYFCPDYTHFCHEFMFYLICVMYQGNSDFARF